MTACDAAALAEIAAAVAGVLLARRQRGLWPVALLLAGDVIAEGARRAMEPFVVSLDGAPLRGFARALAHVDLALYLGSELGLAAASVWVCLAPGVARRIALAGVGVAWASSVAILASLYPHLRGEALAPVYRGIHLAALAACVIAGVHWMARREAPTLAQRALLVLVAVEGATLLAGPWRLGIYDHWHLADIAYVVLYGGLALAFGAYYAER